MDDTKLLATIEEARAALALSRSKFYELMQAGEIRTVHIGTARRIPVEALREYVERLREHESV